MAVRITATISAPISVFSTPPTPPVSRVPPPPPPPPAGGGPPISTATMAGSKKPSAMLGAPPASFTANKRPAKAEMAPARPYTAILYASTRRPDAMAAGSPAPMALSARPKTVRRSRNNSTSSSAAAMKISLGTPAVLPMTQPNATSRAAGAMNTACCPHPNYPIHSPTTPRCLARGDQPEGRGAPAERQRGNERRHLEPRRCIAGCGANQRASHQHAGRRPQAERGQRQRDQHRGHVRDRLRRQVDAADVDHQRDAQREHEQRRDVGGHLQQTADRQEAGRDGRDRQREHQQRDPRQVGTNFFDGQGNSPQIM